MAAGSEEDHHVRMIPHELVHTLRLAGVRPIHRRAPTVAVHAGAGIVGLPEELVEVGRDARQLAALVVLHGLEDQLRLRGHPHVGRVRVGVRRRSAAGAQPVAQNRTGDMSPMPAVDVVGPVPHPIEQGHHPGATAAVLEVIVQFSGIGRALV